MEFIETSPFTRLVYDYLSEDEYHDLQVYLLYYPGKGNLVPAALENCAGLKKEKESVAAFA